MAERQLLVRIVGDDASLQRALGNASAISSGFGDRIMATGKRVSAVGKKMTRDITLPVAAAFGLSIHEAEKLDKAVASLQVGLKKNGLEVGGNTAKVKAFAAQQSKYGMTQDQVIQGVARGVEFTGSLTKAMQGYQMALVISKATGKSYNGVQLAVNKAMAGQTSALSRYIGTIAKGTPAHVLFNDVMKKFGGQAKANTSHADQLKAKFQNLGQNLGTIVLPIFNKVVDFVGKLVSKFQGLSPNVQKVILIVAGLVAAIGPVLSIVGSLATVIGAVASPIALVVGGIVLLVGAIAAAVIWPDKLKSVLERMGLSAHAAGEIVGGLREVFNIAKDAAMAVVSVIQENWPQIKAIALDVFDIVKSVITTTVHVVEGIWRNFGGMITSVVKTAWGFVKGTIKNALEVIRGIIDVISGLIHGDWSKVWNGITEIVGGSVKQIWNVLRTAISVLGAVAGRIGSAIWNGMKNGATAVINWIIGQLNHIVNAYNAVFGWLTGNIAAIGAVGGGRQGPKGLRGPAGAAIPGHAAGGIFTRPHLAVIAEKGPELVLPLTSRMPAGGSPLPAGWAGGRGGGHMTFNVTLYAPHYVGDKRQLGETVVSELSKWARRNGNQELRTVLGAAGA